MSPEERMEICKACPLYKDTFNGPKCNDHKYMNDEGKTSWVEKPGYKHGCGCFLKFKVLKINALCPCGKW